MPEEYSLGCYTYPTYCYAGPLILSQDLYPPTQNPSFRFRPDFWKTWPGGRQPVKAGCVPEVALHYTLRLPDPSHLGLSLGNASL